MKMLESAYEFEKDPYSTVNLLDLIKKTQSDDHEKEANPDSQSTTLSDSSEYSSLNIQIQAIKVYI